MSQFLTALASGFLGGLAVVVLGAGRCSWCGRHRVLLRGDHLRCIEARTAAAREPGRFWLGEVDDPAD